MKAFKSLFGRGKSKSPPEKSAPAPAHPAPPPAVVESKGPGGAKGDGRPGKANPFVPGSGKGEFCAKVSPGGSAPSKSGRQCVNQCGWTAFGSHSTCCKLCVCPAGPHSQDCPVKNTAWVQLCAFGCGRPAYGSFVTCCTKCSGPTGPHAKNCAEKGRKPSLDGTEGFAAKAAAPKAAEPPVTSGPLTADDISEELRRRLVDWQRTGRPVLRAQVDEFIASLAGRSGWELGKVRLLWLAVARQARPVGAPGEVYTTLARRHHGVEVEVIDLGAKSAKHHNSCMFLTCSLAVVERRCRGFCDDLPPGVLGEALAAAAPETNAGLDVDEIIEQHRRTHTGTLGRMADALRHAACEMLASDKAFFRPYFSPVRGRVGDSEQELERAYDRWVGQLRGNEEGDELVILAVSRLLGMAVQPVQQSGYCVPLMDPTGAGEDKGYVSYWGNDDKHWVFLRVMGTVEPEGGPEAAGEAPTSPGAAAAAAAGAPAVVVSPPPTASLPGAAALPKASMISAPPMASLFSSPPKASVASALPKASVLSAAPPKAMASVSTMPKGSVTSVATVPLASVASVATLPKGSVATLPSGSMAGPPKASIASALPTPLETDVPAIPQASVASAYPTPPTAPPPPAASVGKAPAGPPTASVTSTGKARRFPLDLF